MRALLDLTEQYDIFSMLCADYQLPCSLYQHPLTTNPGNAHEPSHYN